MIKNAKFIKSVYSVTELPKDNLPEVVLCGRSNVGKSSFINTLLNKKNLAKTSSTPGKTQSLNYYLIENKFYFVDLPGYGYAKTSKSEREKWAKLISNYFQHGTSISMIFHIIDSRHEPSELDIEFNHMLKSYDYPYTVILNKIDKLKQSEIAAAKKNIKEVFPELSLNDNLKMFSAVTGLGKKEIISLLSKLYIQK